MTFNKTIIVAAFLLGAFVAGFCQWVVLKADAFDAPLKSPEQHYYSPGNPDGQGVEPEPSPTPCGR